MRRHIKYGEHTSPPSRCLLCEPWGNELPNEQGANTVKLTNQHIAFFKTFGYLVVRELLTPTEVKTVTQAFDWSIQNWGGGDIHDGSKRTMLGGPIEHTPELCALLDHSGVVGLIGGVIGADFNYCSGDGNYYTCLLYTSPSPRDRTRSRMPSSA